MYSQAHITWIFLSSCNGFICNDYFHASAFLEFLFCIPVLLGNGKRKVFLAHELRFVNQRDAAEMPVPEKLAEWLVEVLIGPGTICLHIFPENQVSEERLAPNKQTYCRRLLNK